MKQETNDTVRVRRTREQIEQLLSEFGKAAVTAREFCRDHHINLGTFHKWQSRGKNKSLKPVKRPGFAQVLIDSSGSNSLFAEVNGIRLYQAVSAEFLKSLLA